MPDITPAEQAVRQHAFALFKPPFKFQHGYIFDSAQNMVADGGPIARVRGWGRISYMDDAEALQDEVGAMIAEALTAFWTTPTTQTPPAGHEKGMP